MKRLFAISIVLIITAASLRSSAAIQLKTFDAQAETLLAAFGLEMGANQTITISNGVLTVGNKTGEERCEVIVANSTEISPNFPQSSKLSQKVQITMIVNPGPQATGSSFKLHRSQSKVVLYEKMRTTGMSRINVGAINPTGIGSGTAHQYLSVEKRSNAARTLSIAIKDGHKQNRVCVFESARR